VIHLRLSVVVPTYNRAALLAELLRVTEHQTLPTRYWELIVVDDASGDWTPELLASWRPNYNFRWIRKENGGAGQARNAGAAQADGDLLVFFDDDVVPHADCLEAHFKAHQEATASVVIGRILGDESRLAPAWERWEEVGFARAHAFGASGQASSVGELLYTANTSLSKATFESVGGFNPALRRAEDSDLGRRLEAAGVQFRFDPSPVVMHHGYRTLDDWQRLHYGYGRLWAEIGDHSVDMQALAADVQTAYRGRHPLMRRVLQLAVGRSKTAALLTAISVNLGRALFRLGLKRPSRWAFSVAGNVLRWQGLADRLGGRRQYFALLGPAGRPLPAGDSKGWSNKSGGLACDPIQATRSSRRKLN
jgi:GT2 family glycosyltransferase